MCDMESWIVKLFLPSFFFPPFHFTKTMFPTPPFYKRDRWSNRIRVCIYLPCCSYPLLLVSLTPIVLALHQNSCQLSATLLPSNDTACSLLLLLLFSIIDKDSTPKQGRAHEITSKSKNQNNQRKKKNITPMDHVYAIIIAPKRSPRHSL